MSHAHQFRFFRGRDTAQTCGFSGKPALPDKWYFEPLDYEGGSLWSSPYGSFEEARDASENDPLGV